MLRHELNRMIHVARLKHKNAAQLFLGFAIGTVGGRDFAVLPIQGQRCFTGLKGFSTNEVPVRAKMVVILEAFIEQMRRAASFSRISLPREFIKKQSH
jgi:hypothetical protein